MSIRVFRPFLLALFVLGVLGVPSCAETSGSNPQRAAEAVGAEIPPADLQTVALTVPNMLCPICANSVRTQLRAMGVHDARVDLEAKLVTGRFDPRLIDPRAIRERIERSGFVVSDMRVD